MQTQLLPYQKNSTELFDHFAHLPFAVFLDSNAASTSGRYDIISADPIDVFDHANTVFQQVQNALADLKNKAMTENNNQLPFTIGAIGYMSYDVARTLEKMPSIAIDDIQLPVTLVGIYNWSIVVDHVEQKTVLTTMDLSTQKKILAFMKKKPAPQQEFSITQKFKSNLSKTDYKNAFNNIKKNIIAGNCYQVNFAQRFSADFIGSPWNAYKKLRKKNPAPYSAFFSLDNGAIISCSPERFLKVKNNIVETKPIKGTAKRFSNPVKDKQSANNLLLSEKDRAENVMIVDLLRNDLSRTCTDVTVQQLCALESFSNVHHLVSTITGKLAPERSLMNLFQACFPGGSITGAPKIAAMTIIESLEPHRRSIYCGNLFYADIFNQADSNILIRTAICDHNTIHCYAGGGIVFDSECKSEYAETQIKIKKMIRALEN